MIDEELEKISPLIKGQVLDLGGKKHNKRGCFVPPAAQVKHWWYLNSDPIENPDVIAKGEQLPFKANSFDWIICTEVLEFIQEPAQLFDGSKLSLKRGAFLFLTAPFLYRIHGRPHDLQRFTKDKLISLVREAGLTLHWIKPQGYYFTVLADLFKSAVDQIGMSFLRNCLKFMMLPFLCILRYLDRLRCVSQSDFFSSFTTGYAMLVSKQI